ncbi:sulfatase-like hydrolase/transferase, partial [bacterium]|nr:sulfatase-like hydrolase/transferase [bacterium]
MNILRNIYLAAVLSIAAGNCGCAGNRNHEKPNIVFIITDDQGYGDLSCHGHPVLETPNLDRLKDQSVSFTCYHASPTCSPTRAAIMSGRDPFYVGVTHTIFERERLALKVPTLPEMLKKAGYTTGLFGKWHLGDQEPYRPDKRGFDEVFQHGGGGIGQSYSGSCGDAPDNNYFDPIILHNEVFEKTKGFCTDVFVQEAISWIEKNKNKKPFFAFISTNAAHGPFICPEKYKKPFIEAGYDANQVGFHGMISNIDENIGLIM